MIIFCPTPIGNLKDITLRVLETLREADVIACEDTRHTRKLLSHYDIKSRLLHYDDHHGAEGLTEILDLHDQGKLIAVVSDAGMPLISDPGLLLIRELIKRDIPFDVLPGASAFVNAWVLSGLEGAFSFQGFLPRKKTERLAFLEALKDSKESLIFYEAPHRLDKTLSDLLTVFGDRRAVLARELTKLYQEVIRLPLSALLEEITQHERKGEMVILVEGNWEQQVTDFDEDLKDLVAQRISKSEIARTLSKRYGMKKDDIYKMLIGRNQ